MATLGYSKLEAVNAILFGINQPRVPSLDTGGTSDAAEVEYVLDLVTRSVLTRGWPCNTERNQTISAADVGSGVFKCTLPGDVLAVRGAGVDKGREFALRGGLLWDIDAGTDTFSSGDSFTVDYLVDLDFDDIDPGVKELIVAEAARVYLLRKNPDPDINQMLREEHIRADIYAPRTRVDTPLHRNFQPFIPPQPESRSQ